MSKYLLHPNPHLSCTTPRSMYTTNKLSHRLPYLNTRVTVTRVILRAETCGQVLLSITSAWQYSPLRSCSILFRYVYRVIVVLPAIYESRSQNHSVERKWVRRIGVHVEIFPYTDPMTSREEAKTN